MMQEVVKCKAIPSAQTEVDNVAEHSLKLVILSHHPPLAYFYLNFPFTLSFKTGLFIVNLHHVITLSTAECAKNL